MEDTWHAWYERETEEGVEIKVTGPFAGSCRPWNADKDGKKGADYFLCGGGGGNFRQRGLNWGRSSMAGQRWAGAGKWVNDGADFEGERWE